MTATKAVPDRLRDIFRRLREGVDFVLPREGTPTPKAPSETVVAQERAQALVTRYQSQFNDHANALARQLASAEISPREFRAKMLVEIRYLLLTAAAAGAGGVGYLRPADIARVDAKVAEQARFLDNWIAQIERQPADTRSEAQIANRARLYGGSANALAQETVDKNVFREFPDLPFMPGELSVCLTNCHCRWEWVNVDRSKGSADVYWRLGVSEHCPTCLDRAGALKPLQIRDWKFVNMPANLDELKYRRR